MILEILAAGFIGGALRAYVGSRKYKVKTGIATSAIALGLIGAVCAAAFIWVSTFQTLKAAALAAGIAGYVGADVIEGLYKIRAKRQGSLA